ncbi:ThuA domain-containing protein [Metabacillus bambusae]|uniref:ThuA domain-containing protein n=1 Tax=Metabacillus bambusae TaxID=2795218 RepID=A0ABS3MZA5_9BACI|nr:ThuA domain-containing protein [Metabacillus bambusae]MBO1511334.1 ThuA domain-containing protein [Metabacillus bambusae]
MKKIVALLGDYYHSEEGIQASLNRALTLLNENEKVECIEIQTSQLIEELKKKPDAVILFKEDRVNPTDEKVDTWMTDEIGETIAQYVDQGGGWLGWHSGLASYADESSYTKMLKGYFEYHPELHSQVKYTSVKGNDVFGPVSFEIIDEHYFVKINQEETNIFLKSESEEGQSIAGWFHDYGKGRVCCLTPAHNKEGLLDPRFTELLSKTIKWVSS